MHHFLKRTLVLLALGSIPGSIASGQNQELLGEYRIGLVGRSSGDAYFQAIRSGALHAARDLGERYSIDVELSIETPIEAAADAQLNAVSKLFVEGMDGLAVSPVDGESLEPILSTISEQGLGVVLFESEIENFQPLASFPAYETRAGRLAGLAVGAKVQGNGRVAILVQKERDARLDARLAGARAALGYRRVYGTVECEPDYSSAIAAIQAAIREDGDDLIEGWVFLGDWALEGQPSLPWQAGEVPSASIGASPTALMHLNHGYVTALIVHPYYEWGYRSVEALIEDLHRPEAARSESATSGPRVIDWTNREDYASDWQIWVR